MKKVIFEGESVLKTWKDCTLTNKRVWRETEANGLYQYKGFPLNKFQGSFVGKTSYPWLLYIGLGAFALSLISLANKNNNVGYMLIFVGLMFTGAWHFLKYAQVTFSSSEIKIDVHLHASNEEFQSALKFVSEIEQAALSEEVKQNQQAA